MTLLFRMKMSFRWFGDDDPVRLDQIRQIPGIRTVVSALTDISVGDPWPYDAIARLAARIDQAGLELGVVESIPVHEDIKLGRPSRDRLIDHYCDSIAQLGALSIPVLCYNFMPIFDWTRTDLERLQPDGSTSLAYDDKQLARIDLSKGTGDLPGWATAHDAEQLEALLTAYRGVTDEQLWEHLAYFLERVVPAAATANVKLAIHPDDPPWPIFGLPRIVTNAAALDRVTRLVDHPANGVTFCTGSLGASAENDLPTMIRDLGGRGRIHFMHCRNVRRTGLHDFHEVAHPSEYGDVDMLGVMRALRDLGYTGPMRPDHGRMIWSERGRPGYGLYDRALGATYLLGLWEGTAR